MSQVALKEARSVAPAQNSKVLALKEQIESLELCRQLADTYTSTAMVPKQYQNKPDDAAVAIQWGDEIGLKPLQALQNVAVVNGSPTLWGDALIALVKQSGQCEYISTDWDQATLTATVSTKRKGEPEEARTFSLEDAKQAGLAGRNTYQQHPKRMLAARARSHVLRDVYADLLKGFQIREILEEDREVYGEGYKKVKDMGAVEVVETVKPEKEARPAVTDEHLAKNLPAYKKKIDDKDNDYTAQGVIDRLQCVYTLTENQINTIKNLEPVE